MNDHVAKIGKNPVAGLITLDTERPLAVLLHLKSDFVADGLVLFGAGAGADYKKVSETGDAGEVEHAYILCFLLLGGSNGREPIGFGSFFYGSFSNRFHRRGLFLCSFLNRRFFLGQKRASDRYRTIRISVYFRVIAFAALATALAFSQQKPPAATPQTKKPATKTVSGTAAKKTAAKPAAAAAPDAPAQSEAPVLPGTPALSEAPADAAALPTIGAAPDEIKPDLSDPQVVRAQENLDRTRSLVKQQIMAPAAIQKAQDALQDAEDNTVLRITAYTQDLTPDQAEQMVQVAQRMLARRQNKLVELSKLADAGVLSRAEAAAGGADEATVRLDVEMAMHRAQLVNEIAVAIRHQKELANEENDAEMHPEWNGKLYVRYDGNGIFTRPEFDQIVADFRAVFHKAIPVTADGQTAVHRALGFNHTGRVDIGLNPDAPEGLWLLRYLQNHHIPYFAFKTAIAHKATGAHIHLGPSSTKLVASLH